MSDTKLSKNVNDMIKIIRDIKSGNAEERNNFISNYEPFIIRCVSHVLNNRFVDKNNNDEYSIGLIAFNEALDKFDERKGKKFLDFAQLVITRRVLNYRIRESKKNGEYLFSTIADEKGSIEQNIVANENLSNVVYNSNHEELIDFENKLKMYNINIMDLADSVPKRKDAKKFCIDVAKSIVSNKYIHEKFLLNKTLPISDILKLHNCSRRTIERNRKFIIASVLVISSNLDTIKEFLNSSS